MAMPSQMPMGIEFERGAAGLDDRFFDKVAHLAQVNVSRDDVRVRVAHGDERLRDVLGLQSRGAKQAAVRRAFKTLLDGIASHEKLLWQNRLFPMVGNFFTQFSNDWKLILRDRGRIPALRRRARAPARGTPVRSAANELGKNLGHPEEMAIRS
jgi:hypothetical protein